jgi:hypothetical protein
MAINVPVSREEKYALILERAHKIRTGDLYELVHGFSRAELLDQLKTILDHSSDDELDTLIAEANGYPDENP